MVRRLSMLLLGAGLALAQEKDDEGITIDEPPATESGKPERTEPYPARATGKKVATVTVKRKVFSLALPADWVLLEEDDPKAEFALEVLLPGSAHRASLALQRLGGGDAKSAPYSQAAWLKKEKPDAKTEIRMKPVPRLIWYRSLDRTDWVDSYFCLSVRNNPYVLQFSCAASDFAQAEADMLVAAQSFTAKVELWPPIPKEYKTSEEGTWLLACAPGVTASTSPLVKALKEQEKRFKRDHGPLPKSDAPIVVLVHASKAQAGKLEPKAAEWEQDFYTEPNDRRMFAVPFAKGNMDQEAMLARAAQGLLLVAKYGNMWPEWIWTGECTAAQAESYAKKPIPALDEGFVGWISTLKLHLLDEFAELERADGQTWGKECFFYVAALREGKYKKQYRAFLDDFAETADGQGAFERHLGSIDQEELRASTNQFISTKIKEEKRAK